MSFKFLGVEFDVDYRGRLARNPGSIPNEVKPLSQMDGFILHYGGGATNWNIGALAIWQSYARYHCQPGRFASGVSADGLMYHCGPTFDGQKALLFDPRVTRWHAGHTHSNRFRVSINCAVGGQQDITRPMQIAIEEMMHDFIKQGVGQNITRIWGHQEVGSTACPGRLQTSTVRPLRQGFSFIKDGSDVDPEPPKPRPNHLIVNVPGVGEFWIIKEIYKRYAMVEEPLFLFGYPLGGMKGDPPYQDFERARLHVVPNSWPERHNVQIAHVGKQLAEHRYGDRFREKRDQFTQLSSFTEHASGRFFPQTGYGIHHGFKSFWEDFGGVEYFGFPISREFIEDGKTVQYFERSRFEHVNYPDWDRMYHNVQLGRVNAELRAAIG